MFLKADTYSDYSLEIINNTTFISLWIWKKVYFFSVLKKLKYTDKVGLKPKCDIIFLEKLGASWQNKKKTG